MTAHSGSDSGPGLSRIARGMATLPASWSQPPRRHRSTMPAGRPRFAAIKAARSATCWAWASDSSDCSAGREARSRARASRIRARREGASPRARTSDASTRGRARGPWRRTAQWSADSTSASSVGSSVPCARRADRDGQPDVVPAEASGPRATASRRRSARRSQLGVGVDSPEQDGELLAAPPRQRLVGCELLVQPPRELDEHGVADRVPVRVVDLLEVIGVQQQERAARRAEVGLRRRRAR